ncbi:hypothetical protein ACGFZP_20415 [Kitasatospora sp. NPDC048239]
MSILGRMTARRAAGRAADAAMKVHEREEPQPTHGWGSSRR